jgi:hypothetical protein
MGRAPLVLLLAAAVPAAAGLWEEVGRNTDVTLLAGAASDLVERGRAPGVGPLGFVDASARLSVPASTLNLVLAAGADRSLDGAPRLDRRFAGLSAAFFPGEYRARLDVRHELNLGVNPATLGRLRSETRFEAAVEDVSLGQNWDLGLELATVPRREERQAEVTLGRLFALREGGPALHLGFHLGDLRALDADGDGQGRVEGWSYAAIRASLVLDVGSDTLFLTFGTQQATDDPGDRDGWVELTYRRLF